MPQLPDCHQSYTVQYSQHQKTAWPVKLKIHIEELQNWYNEHAPLEISVFTITNLKYTASCNTHTIVFIMYCTYFYKVLYYNYSLYSNKHTVILFKCCWDTDRYRSAHLGPKINVFFFPHLLLIYWPHTLPCNLLLLPISNKQC